jgi:hypothetical protein
VAQIKSLKTNGLTRIKAGSHLIHRDTSEDSMFTFSKSAKYKSEVLAFLDRFLSLYALRHGNILQNNPGIQDSISDYFKKGTREFHAALQIACDILCNTVEKMPAGDGKLTADQISQLEMPKIDALLNDVIANKPIPDGMTFNTVMYAEPMFWAWVTATQGHLKQSDMVNLGSEIIGALRGKSFDERLREQFQTGIAHLLFKKIREGDDGPFLPVFDMPSRDAPPLSGTDVKVKLVNTPTGIALVRADNGEQITERRAITQEDLAKVPTGCGAYNFVNLRARSGKIYSCIIAGGEVIGDMRAFWWALANVTVVNVGNALSVTLMTATALARVHAFARGYWNAAIKDAGSIDQMRDQLIPLRNGYMEVISKRKKETASEADRLGLDIAEAMLLATQSEDAKLEGFAYHCFRQFLWQPGEEPTEFSQHEMGESVTHHARIAMA